ncbi:MAG TPA: tetratricopeptide repeat protein [Candidatus Acidoferrales bacterium]|nr:tetratricopeptide repeat protein [Candidatus Acidoferrales bacterium]
MEVHLRFLVVGVVIVAGACLGSQAQSPRQSPGGGAIGESSLFIDGEIHFSDGHPNESVLVRLGSELGGMISQADTDQAGVFQFTGLGAGNYEIDVDVAGYTPVHFPVQLSITPVTGLTLTLSPLPTAAPRTGGSSTVSVEQLMIPDRARAEFVKGMESLDAGRPADAAVHFENAIKIYPSYSQGYRFLAAANADLGRFAQAKAAIQKSFSLDQNNPHTYAYLGYVYLKEQDLARAQQAFEKSISLLDADWFAHLELGRLLLEAKKPADAYPHLVRAHQLHPALASVHLELYDDLLLLGRKKEAVAELDDFLAHFPNDPRAAKIRQIRQSLDQSLAGRQAH